MAKEIKLDFFDINGEYKDDVEVDIKKNFLLLDSPMRILDQFINENFLQDLKKETDEDKFITKYKFSYELKPDTKITINCDIINIFSVSHQSTLNSKGYIVFCNLESECTYELLEKIIDYIIENCSLNVKTYMIGVFKDKIDEDKTYAKMKNYFSKYDFECDYYEMYLGNNDKFEEIKKKHIYAENMRTIFSDIFDEINGGRKENKNLKEKEDKIKEKNKAQDRSFGFCEII